MRSGANIPLRTHTTAWGEKSRLSIRATMTTTGGASTTYSYNAFGQESSRVAKVDNLRTRTSSNTYDSRGLLIQSRPDITGIDPTESRTYDAFARLTSVTDANGKISRF